MSRPALRQAQCERISEGRWDKIALPQELAGEKSTRQEFSHVYLAYREHIQSCNELDQPKPVRAEPACPELVEGSKHERRFRNTIHNGSEITKRCVPILPILSAGMAK